MKRDMDLIREILLYIEANYKPGMGSMHIELEGFSSSLILEHCKLAFDSGLLQFLKIPQLGMVTIVWLETFLARDMTI